jgi:prephenate dehydrogenase
VKLGIIGAGAMGGWFARFAKQNGWNVSITDINVAKAHQVAKEVGIRAVKSNEEAVMDADVAIVAVPIAVTPRVVKEISKHLKPSSLLMDVASAKTDVIDEMRKLDVKFELVSLHPLFGPGAKSIKGRTFVSVPIRPGKIYREFRQQLKDLGAKVVEMKADDHDRLMAITQCMTHFVLMTYLSALKSMKNAKRAEKLQTPISSSLFELAQAFLATSPDMHGELQVQNKYASIARSAMLEACRSLDVALKAGNVKALREIFEDARRLIGPAKPRAAYKKLYEEEEA